MGQLTRDFDWATTSLGPSADWPQSLKTAIAIMLTSRYPMLIWWGPERIHFYNDAYIPVLGKRHPAALSQPAPQVWAEAWPTVGPMADRVITEGVSTWSEELPILMTRNGYPEEVYMTFSYSPLRDDTGQVAGLFCACTEETQRVLGRRRLRTLRSLAEQTAPAKTTLEACRLATIALADNSHDLPFALVYLLEEDGQQATLGGLTGLDPGTPASPQLIDLQQSDTVWPLRAASQLAQTIEVVSLPMRFAPVMGSVLPKGPERALVLPIARPGQDGRLAGWLVAAIDPLRSLDEDYHSFLKLVAGQLATALASASAYEEERKRAEALAEIDRAKTAFFSNVSHEFRTPLTLMLGPLEDTLADDQLTPSLRERITVAYRNSQRLLKLVNTLLDFSRLEAGRIEAVYEPVDLTSFTAELASVFRSAIERAGMQLLIDCPPLAEPVYVDREMWEKIVLNLLSNAFKFTFQGAITVRLLQVDQTIQLSVSDTGTGIPADELPHLFAHFKRVKGARGRSYEGSGIGLALVQELVRLHGGQIAVQSQLDQGTTFIITLPLGKAHLPADRIGSPRRLSSTGLQGEAYLEEALRWLPLTESASFPLTTDSTIGTIQAGRRADSVTTGGWVLVVDDNVDMREYVQRLLGQHYPVMAVADGLAALEAIHQQAFDLVLADVMMPRLDGFGLLKALRADERTRTLPVILLSARAGEESRVDGLQAGADDYLIKPFSARELRARVEAHLRLHQLRQQAQAAITQSEERLRRFVDASSDMVYQMSADWSQKYFLTGKGFLADMLAPSDHWVSTYILQEDQADVWQAIQTAIDAQQPFELEHRVRRTDSTVGWVFSRALPVWNESGQLTEWFGAASDITFRKLAEEALKQADQRKDEFLAMLGHELRNPMTTIRAGLQILALAADQEEMISSMVAMMDRQTDHLVRMVDDLLDVSRISRGKIELQKEQVNLARLVQQAVESLQPLFAEQGKFLHIKLPPAPIELEGDVTRLTQIVTNLLTNGARYTGEHGQVWLSLEHRAGPAGLPEAILQVRDNGIGLASDQLETVFELFVQVDNSLARSKGGLGLGLTLVKRLVEMHGGRVEAQSEGIDKGSTFTVHLPTLTAAAEPTSKSTPPVTNSATSNRILVIDDNADAAFTVAMLLKLKGYETHTRTSGRAGIEAAEALQPEAILLDIGMPQLDGYETCRLIRAQGWGKAVVVIALTGYGQDEDLQRTKEAGFDGHLVKPVDLAALLNLLTDLLDKEKKPLG